ncbi:MAG: hypothetical protein AAF772_17155 [Acidobacteriota bacterium]
MSIVKGMVDGMSGHITVDTEVGRGTTFRVLLPATPSAGADSPS